VRGRLGGCGFEGGTGGPPPPIGARRAGRPLGRRSWPARVGGDTGGRGFLNQATFLGRGGIGAAGLDGAGVLWGWGLGENF